MVAPVYVLYRTEKGDFEKAEALKTTEGEHLIARSTDRSLVTDQICTEPFAYDWDGDGDLDFLIGNFSGTFLLATNVGTRTEPKFEAVADFLLDAKGERLKIQGHHSAPFLIDWDGDGDVDIVSGSSTGNVQIAENDPTEDGAHRFHGFRELLAGPLSTPRGICAADTPITPSRSSRVCVADYNGDGKLDLIVGDCMRRSHPAEGLTVEEANQKQKEWSEKQREMRKAMNALRAQIADPELDAEAKQELQKQLTEQNTAWQAFYKKRSEFIAAVATGHVWVYIRK